ncbi:MAG: hypothetical protein K5851_03035 [Lachnospiraceae bacterium]|nr:hypothetical protein [Lachnospiraceae bacterium]
MGDWGKVIFLYDYECDYKSEFWREDSETYREKTQGMFVKNYRSEGRDGVLLHAYYGMRYFMERFDHSNLDLAGYRNSFSNLAEIDTAFDVFMDIGRIELGFNSVEDVVKNWGRNKKRYEEKTSELKYDLFGVDETDGVFYIYFSGKPETGYTLKYAYRPENEIQDLLPAIENDWERYYYRKYKEEIDKAIKFFEEKGTLITSNKDLKFIENRGTTIVQQAMETN